MLPTYNMVGSRICTCRRKEVNMKKRRQMHTMLKEAVSKDKWKDFGAVFLIILFLPYLCVTFFGNNRFFKNNIAVGSPWKIEEMSLDKNSFYIKKEVAAGSELIPIDRKSVV